MATKAQKAVTQGGHQRTKNTKHLRSEDNSPYSATQNRHIEVDKQSDAHARNAQITDDLGNVHRMKLLYGFDLND